MNHHFDSGSRFKCIWTICWCTITLIVASAIILIAVVYIIELLSYLQLAIPPGTQREVLGLKPGRLPPGKLYLETTEKEIETAEQA